MYDTLAFISCLLVLFFFAVCLAWIVYLFVTTRGPELESVRLTLDSFTIITRGKIIMATINTDQHVGVTATLNGAYEAGTARWTATPEGIVTITPDPANELAAEIRSGPALGAVEIKLVVDADTDAGEVRELTIVDSLVVKDREATAGSFAFSEAVDN